MNRRLLLSLIFIFSTSFLLAQNDNNYKGAEDYFKNVGKVYWDGIYTQGAEVGVGIGEETQFISVYGSAYLGESTFFKVGGMYEFATIRGLDYAAIYGDITVNYKLFSIGNIFHLYLTGGGTAVYDDIYEDLQTQIDHDFSDFNGWNFGVLGGGEAKFFVGKRIALLGFANQRYFIQDGGFGSERYFVGVGLKYAFKYTFKQ